MDRIARGTELRQAHLAERVQKVRNTLCTGIQGRPCLQALGLHIAYVDSSAHIQVFRTHLVTFWLYLVHMQITSNTSWKLCLHAKLLKKSKLAHTTYTEHFDAELRARLAANAWDVDHINEATNTLTSRTDAPDHHLAVADGKSATRKLTFSVIFCVCVQALRQKQRMYGM